MIRTVYIETADDMRGYVRVTCRPGETIADAVARIPDAVAWFDGSRWRVVR